MSSRAFQDSPGSVPSPPMPANKKAKDKPLTGAALIKETCRRIRVARSYWDAHNNRACRGEREKALALYESLSGPEREKVPQVLRVWLRYRSEKYFGEGRTPPGSARPVTTSQTRATQKIERRFVGSYSDQRSPPNEKKAFVTPPSC